MLHYILRSRSSCTYYSIPTEKYMSALNTKHIYFAFRIFGDFYIFPDRDGIVQRINENETKFVKTNREAIF